MIVCLTGRQAPAVAVVEQKNPLAAGVLAEVALGSPGCFAPFDDLLALTVRASDGDESHGPFLPKGGYEDEAQCDSHLSLSPLLKHYQPEYKIASSHLSITTHSGHLPSSDNRGLSLPRSRARY